jgi:hypothetical protein
MEETLPRKRYRRIEALLSRGRKYLTEQQRQEVIGWLKEKIDFIFPL